MKIERRPDEDWERIEEDDDIVRPEKKPEPKQEKRKKVNCAKCK